MEAVKRPCRIGGLFRRKLFRARKEHLQEGDCESSNFFEKKLVFLVTLLIWFQAKVTPEGRGLEAGYPLKQRRK